MTEEEFTKSVVMPLFEQLGWKVEHFGGPYEGGKDVIISSLDRLNDLEYGVLQIKKLKPVVSTRRTATFSDLVNQLQQASEKTIPNLDGLKRRPRSVYFVTPYNVDTRAIESRFEAYAGLSTVGVRVLDGAKIADLLAGGTEGNRGRICGGNRGRICYSATRCHCSPIAREIQTRLPRHTHTSEIPLSNLHPSTLFYGNTLKREPQPTN